MVFNNLTYFGYIMILLIGVITFYTNGFKDKTAISRFFTKIKLSEKSNLEIPEKNC